MRVILDDGEVIELGEAEATPTIGFKDYSRRETDAFGVTTVVERNFARAMALKLIVPFDQASVLQRKLASLRATAAQWVADERYTWLNFRGFYKDFEIDLAVPPISYCTLTVEGLAASEAFTDDGRDPAPQDMASTLRLLQPAVLDSANLLASNVPENDHPEWSAALSYPLGTRVIKTATHRIYESAADNNAGNDPAGASGLWTDIGATNRWAMFDQALGSLTTRTGSIAVTIQTEAFNAIALLDVTAATVRVQIGASYDQAKTISEDGSALFLDIPETTDPAVVTITGPGQVSVGTLLIGKLVGLGLTEDSAKASITDYSRREEDEFGEVEIVKRSWGKRLGLRSVFQTIDLDTVASRIAAVRARPALWIGADGIDALITYGFCSDFSIAVDSTISRLSLTIEGLSTAGKIEPLGAHVNWPDIADPIGTKPADNATVGAPSGTPVGDGNATAVIDALKALGSTTSAADIVEGARALVDQHQNNLLASYAAQLLGEERRARWERLTHLDGTEVTTRVRQEVNERIEQGEAIVEMVTEIEAAATDGINAAMAAITQEQLVRASADAAETLARETAISLFQSDVDGQVTDLQAAIVSEATTRADADSAEASLREALAATLTSDIADVNAALLTESVARVTADAAEVTAREALATTLTTDIAHVSAMVLTEQAARISEDEALASSVATVEASLNGVSASVEVIAAAQVTAEDSVALLSTTVEARTASRIEFVAIGGNNRADLRLFADANGGAGARLVGDLEISGDVFLDGDIRTSKLIEGAITNGGPIVKATAIGLTWSNTYFTIGSLTVTPYSPTSVYIILASVRGRATYADAGVQTPVPFQISVTNTDMIDVNTNTDITNQYSAVTTVMDVITGLTASTTFALRARANLGNSSTVGQINNASLLVLEFKR